MATSALEKLGGIGNAHLFIYSEHKFTELSRAEPSRHLGVLSSMNFQDVIRELVPVGESHPRTYEEMRAFVTKAAARYPGEVIPFEVSDVTRVEFNRG